MTVPTFASEEERQAALAEAIASCEENRVPRFEFRRETMAPPPLSVVSGRSSTEQELDDGILSLSDLHGGQLFRYREYEWPNTGGKKVYLFPLSGTDAKDLAIWAGLVNYDLREDDDAAVTEGKKLAGMIEMSALQVIVSCYRDRERKRRMFKRSDLSTLLANVPFEVLSEVRKIVEALGTGEEDALEARKAFFERMRGFLKTLSSRLSTCASCQDGLEAEAAELSIARAAVAVARELGIREFI